MPAGDRNLVSVGEHQVGAAAEPRAQLDRATQVGDVLAVDANEVVRRPAALDLRQPLRPRAMDLVKPIMPAFAAA